MPSAAEGVGLMEKLLGFARMGLSTSLEKAGSLDLTDFTITTLAPSLFCLRLVPRFGLARQIRRML